MREIEESREMFARGDATVQEVPELDVAIVELPRAAHAMAVNEQTDCTRVVRVIEGHRYEMRYRYESWVEFQSRRPLPRIDMRPFADLLQTFEGNPGEWKSDGPAELVPAMRFEGPEGPMSSSSLTPGLFVRLLQSYLSDNASNEALQWSAYDTAAAYSTGIE